MMNVQRMRRIVDVIESGALPGAAQEAARRWQGESLRYVRSSANHVFRFSLSDQGTCYLRLTPAAERRRASIQAELELVEHVAQMGVAVARPLPSIDGALIEEVQDTPDALKAGSPSDTQRYYAVVFEGLRGRELELDELNEAQFRAWGRALALLHQASQTFPPHPARPRWLDEIQAARTSLPVTEPAAARVLDAGAAWLEAWPVEPTEYGLLHGDCELDNLVWDGERPQVLDFDSAVYAPYALDIAIACQDVWQEEGAQRDDHMAWFYAGYSEIRPLPIGSREAMPRLLSVLAAFKVATLTRAYATSTAEEAGARQTAPADAADPPWLVGMRTRHQQWLERQRAALAWK